MVTKVIELKGGGCKGLYPALSIIISSSQNKKVYYRTGNICCRSEAMKRYIGPCLPHAGRYMQSRTGAVTQVSILPQSFFCYCRITFLLLPHHFFAFAASFFLVQCKLQ